MPLIETRGAASAQGFGLLNRNAEPVYIESCFSTFLYTGTGSTQTITNGVDLSGKGGLVWAKSRSSATGHVLIDTVRGRQYGLNSASTSTGDDYGTLQSNASVWTFNSNGYTLGNDNFINWSNSNGVTYASWTFRKQPRFFDVVTWTGDGTSDRVLNHSLGSAPGAIFIKCTSNADDWWVTHRSVGTDSGDNSGLRLNTNDAASNYGIRASTNSSTTFTLKGTNNVAYANTSGRTYVAYLFAHDAGGFGLTGADNVISCGSFTTDGSGNATVTLGYEPQWVLIKASSTSDSWRMFDNMRGMPTDFGGGATLFPNSASAESGGSNYCSPTATGFKSFAAFSTTYIYIAIRRGPMRVPTSGTSVFGLNARSGTGANATVTGSAGVSDAALIKNRGSAVGDLFASRLTGTGYLETSSTAVEVAAGTTILQSSPWDVMDGIKVGTTSTITNASSNTYINYLFCRAPGFFDVVCYTGTGSARTVTHNLGAVPELMIVKRRDGVSNWATYAAPLGNTQAFDGPNTDGAAFTASLAWNNTTPTASVFTVGTANSVNQNAATYVAYLFASCPGVSKVGTYTGTGNTLQINCGFTGGARFVLIKRTDSTGDWYVWDTARGIVASTDPYLVLNSTAAEVTSTDWVDTYSAGFELSNAAGNNVNINTASYIFLSIA